jgi:pimeloyl-ACP methyl ester carboxylesterase
VLKEVVSLFIKLANLHLHYKILGHGEPIILLHGWGRNINYFAELAEHLSRRFTVYLLDLPGFGLSTLPEGVWGSADYAFLIKRFMEAFKIIDPILLGHSFGGKIVIHLAVLDEIKIKKIILISSSGIQLSKSLPIKLRTYFFKLLKFLVRLPIIKNVCVSKIEIYRQRFGSNDYINTSGIMRSILVRTLQENVMRLLPKIKQPALLIWGDQDIATPLEAGRIMQHGILGSQLKIITGSGHFPFLDNWENVIREIDNFLS